MRRLVVPALALLLLAPLGIAHEGSHGIELVDLHLRFRPVGLDQEAVFTLENDAAGPATQLKARVTLVADRITTEFPLDPMAAGETRDFVLTTGSVPTVYGCVQVVAYLKASDLVCAFTDGAVLA